MFAHPAVGRAAHKRATSDDARGGFAAERKVEVPHQKRAVFFDHLLRHDKARAVQAVKHVFKNTAYGRHTLHLIEGVFEARIGGVQLLNLCQVLGLQLGVKSHQSLDGGAAVFGGVHDQSPVARCTIQQYRRCDKQRKTLSTRVKRLG